nr:hypothetical protein [Bacteroidota bacterium]
MKKFFLISFMFVSLISIKSFPQHAKFNFDLSKVPFSFKGSYLAISMLDKTDYEGEGLYIRNVSGKSGFMHHGANFLLEVMNDSEIIEPEYQATPEMIRLISSEGKAEIVFHDEKAIRIRGTIPMRLTTIKDESWGIFTIPNRIQPEEDRTFSIISFDNNSYQFSILDGQYEISRKEIEKDRMVVIDVKPSQSGFFEIVLDEFESGWLPREYKKSFEECIIDASDDFIEFKNNMPIVPHKYEETRTYAAYVNWSCIVEPRGLLKREGMFMSKNLMTNIWSWDHCFNAMALANGLPDKAWDQFMVMFDLQDEAGNMPDMVNPTRLYKGITKPPIHGWTIKKLMEFNNDLLTRERLQIAYNVLSKQVAYWFNYRDIDGNKIPQYINGCDSGWDNSTVFDSTTYVEGPDLSAYLIYQMDVLAEIAKKLDQPDMAKTYEEHANDLLSRFIERSWNGEKFVHKEVGSELYNKESRSLISYLPLILGERLPKNIREKND